MGVTNYGADEFEQLAKAIDRLAGIARERGISEIKLDDLVITMGPDPKAPIGPTQEEINSIIQASKTPLGRGGGDPLNDPYTYQDRGVPSFRVFDDDSGDRQ